MAGRKGRAQTARITIEILNQGFYQSPSGRRVELSQEIRESVEGSIHYHPDDFVDLYAQRDAILEEGHSQTSFDSCNETTLSGARRLLAREDVDKVLCLNFASAKNPGGGFLNGSQAQEESLARASALYPCLRAHFEMYEINRGSHSCLYSDHMIYSPQVPVFRDDEDRLLEVPYAVSFISSPAVNVGVLKKEERRHIQSTMLNRIENILTVAVVHRYRFLVLGAWGCGVFRNAPENVAEWFAEHLFGAGRFSGAFHHVLMSVLDRSKKPTTLQAFEKRFGKLPH